MIKVAGHTRDKDNILGPLLLLVAGVGAMATSAEEFWYLGPVISAIAACLIVWFNWGQHALRSHKMKRPFRLDIVGQPGRMVKELHAPPDSECSIQFRIWPLLNFEQHEMIFGFIGDREKSPIPQKVLNEFIKLGRGREQSPDVNEKHSIDNSDNYHIKETRILTMPNNYTCGFIVKTRDPGVYPIRFEMITDSGESFPVSSVFLIVDPRD
jgi:hypothetical protein